MSRVVLQPKYIGERKNFLIDFSSQMDEGTVIDSATCTISVYCGVDPTPSIMLVGTATPVPVQRVQQKIEGGVAGVIYHLTVTATTDTMELLTIHAYLAILDPDTNVADPECCTRIGNASSADGQDFVMTNTLNPVDEYRHGLPLFVIFDDEQTELAPTLNVDGLGAKLMIATESVGLQKLDILSDDVLHLVYDEDADSGNGAFVVLNKIQTQYALFAQEQQDTVFSADTDIFNYPGMPSMVVIALYAGVKLDDSANTLTFDVNADGATMLSTKITIDVGEKTSRTAATPPVFSSRTFFSPWTLSADCDVGATDATGWNILMKFRPLE